MIIVGKYVFYSTVYNLYDTVYYADWLQQKDFVCSEMISVHVNISYLNLVLL